MKDNHLIDETEKDPFALQNQEDASYMDACFAFSMQGCNGESSSRSEAEQSGKTLVLREGNKSLSRIGIHSSRFRKQDLTEIQTRLTILEEERSTIKKVLFEGVNERKRLIEDVYQQFQQIDTSLLSGSITAYSPKERRRGRTPIGLLEILGQTWNPLILSKERRAEMVKCYRTL